MKAIKFENLTNVKRMCEPWGLKNALMFSSSGHVLVSFPETPLPKQSATNGWGVCGHSSPWPQSLSLGQLGPPGWLSLLSSSLAMYTRSGKRLESCDEGKEYRRSRYLRGI